MKLVLGADHGGVGLKSHLVTYLEELGHSVEDVGTHEASSVDYPDFAKAAAQAVKEGRAERGLLICGSGIGMSIAANKVPGIRAAVVSEPISAALCVQHNDAQILCLGARLVGPLMAEAIVSAFLNSSFEGGRHQRRVDKMSALEG